MGSGEGKPKNAAQACKTLPRGGRPQRVHAIQKRRPAITRRPSQPTTHTRMLLVAWDHCHCQVDQGIGRPRAQKCLQNQCLRYHATELCRPAAARCWRKGAKSSEDSFVTTSTATVASEHGAYESSTQKALEAQVARTGTDPRCEAATRRTQFGVFGTKNTNRPAGSKRRDWNTGG